MPQDIYSFSNIRLNMQDLPVSFPSWPGIYTGNDTQRSCICLNIEATVNIRSWSCGMFPRCAINVTGVLLLEITKPPICILHAHHRTLESLQDVYWGFKLDVVAWYSWSLKPQWTADTRTFYMATVVVHRALKHHNFCCCAWFAIILWGYKIMD